MKSIIFVLFTTVLWLNIVFCYFASSSSSDGEFMLWSKKFGKSYVDSETYTKRRDTFFKNKRRINSLNSTKLSFKMELNQFADLAPNEVYSTLNKKQRCFNWDSKPSFAQKRHYVKQSDLPTSVDWRKKGDVSAVKNQGACGSSSAYSAAAAIESHMSIKSNKHYNLSTSQLEDCAAIIKYKCGGQLGAPSFVFEYVHRAPGIEDTKSYPTTKGVCEFNASKAVAFVQRSENITKGDEKAIEIALATAGPVAIVFNADNDFLFYSGGIFKSNSCDSTKLNHAVLVVGYGQTSDNQKYWIVKNSWGAMWGMKGYFLLERGTNMCGMANCASYPIVSTHALKYL